MTKQLSNQTSRDIAATEKTNVTGVMSPALTFTPNDGLALVLKGLVASGQERGIPIFMDLRDSNGDPLPEDTEIAFQYEAPRMDQPQTVTHPIDHIRPWNSLTLNEQQDEEYIDRTKIELKNTEEALAEGETPTLNVRDIDRLHFSINSSTEIDWGQSRFYIFRNAVRVV